VQNGAAHLVDFRHRDNRQSERKNRVSAH
jgi:hypothetical protein